MPGASRGCCDRSLLWLVLSLVTGAIVGVFVPDTSENHDPEPWATMSRILGWMYFMCWSVSFWPQILLNYQRKSTAGLSFEFQLLNFMGFACYSAFNCALFWSLDVQEEYKRRNGGHPSAVRFNDVLFSLHALVATIITLVQIFFYGAGNNSSRRNKLTNLKIDEWSSPNYPIYAPPERQPSPNPASDVVLDQSSSSSASISKAFQRLLYIIMAVFILSVAVIVALCYVGEAIVGVSWLDLLYVLSSAKVVITVIKYVPQVWENWRRQSTRGWNIWNVLLDLSGAVGSFGQLVLDCSSTGDWSGLTGDPAKLMLSNVSLVFDAIFIVQHYCLYGQNTSPRNRLRCCLRCCTEDRDADILQPLNHDIDWLQSSMSFDDEEDT